MGPIGLPAIGLSGAGVDLPAELGTRTWRGRPWWRENDRAQLCSNGIRLNVTHERYGYRDKPDGKEIVKEKGKNNRRTRQKVIM